MQYLLNHKAEVLVLGSILIDPLVMGSCMTLSREDFADPANQMIFETLQSMHVRKAAIDLATVDDDLARRNLLENIGGSQYLVELTMQVPTTLHIKAYVDNLKDQSNRRRICDIATKMHHAAQDGTNETRQIIHDAQQAMRNITSGNGAKFVSVMDVLLKTYDALERRKAGLDKPIQTGLATFDGLFYGFVPGEFTIIGARPSIGKSAFAATISVNAAKQGKNVVIVSLEMSEIQYGQRLLASSALVDSAKIRHANVSDDELLMIVDAIKGISTIPLDYLFSIATVEQLYEAVQERMDEGKLDLLLIDYMQLMRTSYKADTENNRVAYISRMLKEMTRLFNIPIVALSQLNREVQKQQERKPKLSDLRDSGAIEQDADNVILLHRPSKADAPGVDTRDKEYFNNYAARGLQYLHIGVEKQRQGPVGGGNVTFNPKYMQFAPIDRR